MSTRSYAVEPAKSGRSSCKSCKSKIAKDELRMAVITESESIDWGKSTYYYHPECFGERVRKKPETTKDITHFHGLSRKQQKYIKKSVWPKKYQSSSEEEESEEASDEEVSDNDSSDDVKKTTKTRTRVSRKRKRRFTDSDYEEEDNDSESDDDEFIVPPKKRRRLNASPVKTKTKTKAKGKGKTKTKTKKSKDKKVRTPKTSAKMQKQIESDRKKRKELWEDLSNYTNAQLKEMLRHNDQKVSGAKADLMDRIIDCKMWGKPPRCPDCGGARLRVSYPQRFGHHGQGTWSCPGYFDDDTFVRCKYKSTDAQVRDPWEDL